MAKKQKDPDGKASVLRAKYSDMTPFRIKKHARSELGISNEIINEAPAFEDLVELCVAKEMKQPLPSWATTARRKPDDDDADADDADADDDDNDDDDADADDDDDKPVKKAAKKKVVDDDDDDDDDGNTRPRPQADDDDDDDKPAKSPKKSPVKSGNEDLLQQLLDLTAIQGRSIESLGNKVDLMLTMSGLTLRNSQKSYVLTDKAFGKIFKQQGIKGMDKVREAVEEDDTRMKNSVDKWINQVRSSSKSDTNDAAEDD